MTLDLAIFIVDTFSCIAFMLTAYYAFVANRQNALTNKHSSDKDRKIMMFYQQSIMEKKRERRIDDMVEYTQLMLTKWCHLTKTAKNILTKYQNVKTKIDTKEFNFKTQKMDDDDIFFDDINLTFWRCALMLACRINNTEENKKFEEKVFEQIDKIREKDIKFNAIIKIMLSNITDLTGPSEFQGQIFECFKNTTDIYKISHDINDIIRCLYTNKLSRSNLMNILKYRIPSNRDDYDTDLRQILGITITDNNI